MHKYVMSEGRGRMNASYGRINATMNVRPPREANSASA